MWPDVAWAESYLHNKWHLYPSSRLATIHQRHRQDRQAGWFLRPDCSPRSECPQFGMPAERRAQFRGPNVRRSQISECAPFRIYEHDQYRVFERTSLQRAYVVPCWQQMGSSAVLRACSSALVLAAWTGVSHPYLCYGDRGKLQNLSPPPVLFQSSRIFFTIHRRKK